MIGGYKADTDISLVTFGETVAAIARYRLETMRRRRAQLHALTDVK